MQVNTRRWPPLLAALATLNLDQQIRSLRPGHEPTFTLPTEWVNLTTSRLASSWNVHLLIDFEDEVKWLLRIRQGVAGSPPADLQHFVVESEVETLRVLNRLGAKVPNAWSHVVSNPDEENSTTILNYFFLEMMPGKKWYPRPAPLSVGAIQRPDAQEKYKKIIDDFVRFQLILADVPFHGGIGSLYPSSLASHPVLNNINPRRSRKYQSDYAITGPLVDFCKPDRPRLLGPFWSNRDRYLAQIDLILDKLFTQELLVDEPLPMFLSHLHARKMVQTCQDMAREENEFYIKHPDSKANQILVSEGSLSAVLDWEWAYVTTKAEAFSSPRFCFGSDRHRAGHNDLSIEETHMVHCYEKYGRPDLADCIRKGAVYYRLFNVIGWSPDVSDLNGLTRAVLGEDTAESLPETQDAWIEEALVRFKNDPRLSSIQKLQETQDEEIKVAKEERKVGLEKGTAITRTWGWM
ncbi:hypothetical protein M231_07163 [Tremella mesenterica]|uniref:Aminoglycoside phosphotransferase domain-containing protein n=1 Tax=Tremella mesenterica TaxID=5217 RepID=A0A4Q1B9V7_TREME|nr:hypothetical protein M231_07163 [Tremella mesenterica]